MTRRQTGPDTATRQAVYERDGYRCRRCSSPDGPFAIHHRRPRGMGGTRRLNTNGMACLVLICDACHSLIESYRTWAYEAGWLVRQNQDPAVVPLLLDGKGRVLLTDFGGVEPVEVAS